jgi:hypothetical protein
MARNKRFSESIPPAAGALFLFFISAYGTGVPPFNQMEPGRFLVPAIIFAAPLSGPAARSIADRIETALPAAGMRKILKPSAITGALICIPLLAIASSRAYYRYTLSTTHPPEIREMIEALQDHTGPPGRLMFEDGLPRRYGFCYLSSVIPLYTGLEQIGGPYPHVFIRHSFTNFLAGETMGAPPGRIPPGKMKKYLNIYNIRYILTASSETESYFDRFPSLEKIWASGPFTLRERTGYRRGIRTESDYDRIRIFFPAGEPVPGEVLLEYHWDRSLRVGPPARISPRKVMDDPVPFVLLEPGGEREVEIRFE